MVLAFGGGIVVGFLGLTDSPETRVIAIAAGIPIVIAAVAAIHAVSLWRSFDGPLGDAIDVAMWSADEERREWAVASPGSGVPRTADQARRWLSSYPETPSNRAQRLAAQMIAGELDDARETLSRYPTGTPFERHRRATDELVVAVVEGHLPTAVEVNAAYAELDEAHRLHAVACRALFDASVAAISGGDWLVPLAAARKSLPPEASASGRRRLWLVLTAVTTAVFVAIGALAAIALIVIG